MSQYRISFYNDMGHLMTTPDYSEIPSDIYTFIFEKIKNKILYATDTTKLGCRFYILKPSLLKEWTYVFNGNTIIMDYSKLDRFNSDKMTYI